MKKDDWNTGAIKLFEEFVCRWCTPKPQIQEECQFCPGKNCFVESVRTLLKQAKQEGIEEAIKLSDEIEAGKETTMEEWKAFKCFRNTLRDRSELKKKEGGDEKKK